MNLAGCRGDLGWRFGHLPGRLRGPEPESIRIETRANCQKRPCRNTSGGNRTPNRRFWKPVLCQLSYARSNRDLKSRRTPGSAGTRTAQTAGSFPLYSPATRLIRQTLSRFATETGTDDLKLDLPGPGSRDGTVGYRIQWVFRLSSLGFARAGSIGFTSFATPCVECASAPVGNTSSIPAGSRLGSLFGPGSCAHRRRCIQAKHTHA